MEISGREFIMKASSHASSLVDIEGVEDDTSCSLLEDSC